MKTFVLMSRLCPTGPGVGEVMAGAKGPKKRKAWMERVQRKCPEVKFLASYALFGGWDFMDIYEAPDEESAAKVSMICSASTDFLVESWAAIPERRLEALAEEVMKGID